MGSIDHYPKQTQSDIQQLRRWINEAGANSIVFFGGAGVSTESGIPDFRSTDGLYSNKYNGVSPEEIVSHSYLVNNTEDFYKFYFDRMVAIEAKPNRAHLKLAELEKRGKLACVITQNIDGLHQAAGSERVLELHGTIWRNYCPDCHRVYSLNQTIGAHEQSTDGVPYCQCGGIVRPDVVLYQEALNESVMTESAVAIMQADLLIVAGTSLAVYPAASFIQFFEGKHLVIVNKTPTSFDRNADLCIPASIGDVLDFELS